MRPGRPGSGHGDSGGDGDGKAKLDVAASMRQLTNAQLIDVQMKVAGGQMTIDEALAAALEQDQLGHNENLMEEKMVCVCIKDPELNTVKIEVFEIPSGSLAKRLADRLNAAGIKAMESQDDPFRPKSNEILPTMAGILGEVRAREACVDCIAITVYLVYYLSSNPQSGCSSTCGKGGALPAAR